MFKVDVKDWLVLENIELKDQSQEKRHRHSPLCIRFVRDIKYCLTGLELSTAKTFRYCRNLAQVALLIRPPCDKNNLI